MGRWTEAERLEALAEHDMLGTPPEEVFDALAQAAARACGASIAAVTLIGPDRQWLKAHIGLDQSETSLDDAFCAHTVRDDALTVVPDASLDPRFVSNPFVTGEAHLRFYAGAPIRTEEGFPLGALCVMDDRARPLGLTPEQTFLLQALADQVSAQLRLRRAVHAERAVVADQALALDAGRRREARQLRALDTGGVGWWEWDVGLDRVVCNVELARQLGIDAQAADDGAPLAVFLEAVDRRDRSMLADALEDAARTGAPFSEEFRLALPGPDGADRWMSARGRCLRDEAGAPASFPGVMIDISARKDVEMRLRESDLGRELALRSARLGRWDHAPVSDRRFFDPRARELLGLGGDEAVTDAVLFQKLHPEDRARLGAALRAAEDANRQGPFRQTFRVVDAETGAVRWLTAMGQSQFENGVCTRFLGVIADVTAEQVAAEHRRLLTGELNHRVKNTMALVMSIVMSSLRGVADTGARAALEERLVALGRAHDLLTAENWSAATVPAVVEGLIHTLSLPRGRLDLAGPALRLGPKPALQLSLALHELATNAIKYGALANDTGRIRMEWGVETRDGVKTFGFVWSERGGAPVAPPSRTGFGSRLVQRATAAEFQGSSVIDYAPTGVVWRLSAPFEGLAERGRQALEALA